MYSEQSALAKKMNCYIIAGPNGAGKTTFAENFLPAEAGCLNFINADLIARGIAPFNPESVALEAGKLFLKRMDAIVAKRESFAFETTLSGLNYIGQIKKWKKIGYEVILYYLRLPNEEMAVLRKYSKGGRGKTMTKESYSKSALNAMHRASKQALEKAANMDLKIPEWKDGKIIFVDPREKLKKMGYLGTQG
jgi:predicted ABC-type ATPase